MRCKMQLCFVILLGVIQCYAQEVRVTTQSVNGNIVFDASVDAFGSRTLVLEFTELKGYNGPAGNIKYINLTSKNNKSVYILKKNESSSYYSYRYTYRYYLGSFNVKPDKEYPYMLPAKEGDELSVSKLQNMGVRLGKSVNDTILGVTFTYKGETDTVYAMRSGYVVDVIDSERKRKIQDNGHILYDQPSQNVTIVEHKDGTFAYYICITNGMNLLQPGDRVIVGQPIAVLEKQEEPNRLSVKLHYLNKDLESTIIIPTFYTELGVNKLEYNKTYKSTANKELITKELTKKEVKKWKK